MVIRLNQQLYT